MRLFLDTNVIVDFLGERHPFYQDAASILELMHKKMVSLSVSVLTLVNCAYVLRKAYSKDVMEDKTKWLCDTFDITPVDKRIVVDAIRHHGKDFEDTVQYYSALSYHPDVILTRDKRGFSDLDIPVMTPAEFLERSRQQ